MHKIKLQQLSRRSSFVLSGIQ